MSDGVYGVALSGLNAAQAGLTTTMHNISNVNTPGYSRQKVLQTASFSVLSGGQYLGLGVNIQGVQRSYNAFLTQQAHQAQAQASASNEYSSRMQNMLDGMGDTGNNLSTTISDFYSGLQTFSTRPGDAVTRQNVVLLAQSLTARFQETAADLNSIRETVNNDIQSVVTQINAYANNIADLNQKVAGAQSSGNSQPNDLLDQRDNAIRELNSLVGVLVTPQTDGSVNLFFANGQALVVSNSAMGLGTALNPSTPEGLDVGLVLGNSLSLFQGDTLSGGTLSTLLQFRRTELADTQDKIGKMAIALASSFNSTQKFGIDAKGAVGSDFFSIGQPRSLNSLSNKGDGSLNALVGDVSQLTGSDYKITKTAGGWDVLRLSDNTTVASGVSLPHSVEGIDISVVDGTAQTGDSFTLQIARQAAGGFALSTIDPSKLAGAARMELLTTASNTGSGVATRLKAQQPAPATVDFTTNVDVVFTSATTYQIRKSSDSSVLQSGTYSTPSSIISYGGWTFELAGAPITGDKFSVKVAETDPAGDNRNASALAALSTTKLISGFTVSESFSSLISQLGSRTKGLQITANAQTRSFDQMVENEQSVAGVNLDEEASNLIRFQQTYQAASRVMSVASKLFDSVLQALQ